MQRILVIAQSPQRAYDVLVRFRSKETERNIWVCDKQATHSTQSTSPATSSQTSVDVSYIFRHKKRKTKGKAQTLGKITTREKISKWPIMCFVYGSCLIIEMKMNMSSATSHAQSVFFIQQLKIKWIMKHKRKTVSHNQNKMSRVHLKGSGKWNLTRSNSNCMAIGEQSVPARSHWSPRNITKGSFLWCIAWKHD